MVISSASARTPTLQVTRSSRELSARRVIIRALPQIRTAPPTSRHSVLLVTATHRCYCSVQILLKQLFVRPLHPPFDFYLRPKPLKIAAVYARAVHSDQHMGRAPWLSWPRLSRLRRELACLRPRRMHQTRAQLIPRSKKKYAGNDPHMGDNRKYMDGTEVTSPAEPLDRRSDTYLG